jgi:hypothetical protein
VLSQGGGTTAGTVAALHGLTACSAALHACHPLSLPSLLAAAAPALPVARPSDSFLLPFPLAPGSAQAAPLEEVEQLMQDGADAKAYEDSLRQLLGALPPRGSRAAAVQPAAAPAASAAPAQGRPRCARRPSSLFACPPGAD